MQTTPANADPLALEIAKRAQEAAAPAVVVLFGSRARGDHRPNSDVDLLVVADGENAQPARLAARDAVSRYLQQTAVGISADILAMTRSEFRQCRLAKQHIAGQADTYGIVMTEQGLDSPERGYDSQWDGYPVHWPETRRRLENVEEYSHHFNEMVDEGHWNQKMLGFMAQQSVENALKGWLSARNNSQNWDHDLDRIWSGIESTEDWSAPGASLVRSCVTELLDQLKYDDPNRPGRPGNWLSDYAVIYRYGGTLHQMTRAERLELQEGVNKAVTAVVQWIHAISGTSESDVFPEGVRPWDVAIE